MTTNNDGWRGRSPVAFECQKIGGSGAAVVVTNHPLATEAGAEVLEAGGNAIDAAVASLFALTVVEPMMVGIAGGGIAHVRTAAGEHHIIDAISTAPAGTHETTFEPTNATPSNPMEVAGKKNELGATSVAVPGNLMGWTSLHEKLGRLPLADLLAPAIDHAAEGFEATPYLSGAVHECAEDFAKDATIASVFMPGGTPVAAGQRVTQSEYAETLKLIAKEGAKALHGGEVGTALADAVSAGGGWLSKADLENYAIALREPIAGSYRGYDVFGPPPPASSGVHVLQMLNIIENADVAEMGFGTPEAVRLLVQTISTAMRDRSAASGDPAFVDVPVARYTSKAYAKACFDTLGLRAGPLSAAAHEGAHTTHVTIADRDGNVVSATHTINGTFGARFMVPGAGIIPNNYMVNFDPNPGRALSIAPGKRVPTSMAPIIATRGGRPAFALGLPGGIRIMPCAFQGIINMVDHGMSVQEAVEAPRVWTDGHSIEIEESYGEAAADAVGAPGDGAQRVQTIGGGMTAILFGADGSAAGGACWRADGTVIGYGGGLAKPGVRFWPGAAASSKGANGSA
ncbi:MAG: gamma-glutamyltransferase [Pseudomonadota bacterium]